MHQEVDEPTKALLKIREMMRYHNLSNDKISKQMDVSTSWVNGFSSGKNMNPTFNRVDKLFQVITGESIMDVLERTGYEENRR